MDLQIFQNTSILIINFLGKEVLYSSIVFLVAAVFSYILRNKSSFWQFGLWSLVLLRLVLPLDFALPTSGRVLLQKISLFKQFQPNTNFSVGHFQEELLPDLAINPEAVAGPMGFAQFFSLANILIAVWLFGVIMLLGLYIKRYSAFYHLVKNAPIVMDSQIVRILGAWKKQFKINRPVFIVSSSIPKIPFTIGTIRPKIYIPENILQQRDNKILEPIIAHEMAHVKRYDDLFIRLQSLVQIIYFFHPVVWITTSRMNLARECLCDQLVLSKERLKLSTYAHGLLQVLKMNTIDESKLVLLPALGNHKNKLKTRFQKMKGENGMKKSTLVFSAIGIAIIALTVLPMAEETVSKSNTTIASDSQGSSTKKAGMVLKYGDNKVKHLKEIVGEGAISLRFGKTKHPFKEGVYDHKGLDIKAKLGSAINSFADGTVVKTNSDYEPNKGAGKYITLQHTDGIQTRYTHLNEIFVTEGQTVKAGEQIAKVGSTGMSTGPHLHFEVIKDGERVNPLDYVLSD